MVLALWGPYLPLGNRVKVDYLHRQLSGSAPDNIEAPRGYRSLTTQHPCRAPLNAIFLLGHLIISEDMVKTGEVTKNP